MGSVSIVAALRVYLPCDWRYFVSPLRLFLLKILEILLPVGFVCILVGIKAGLASNENFKPQIIPEYFPIKEDPVIPLTMTDYLIGLRAKRLCNTTSDNFYDKNRQWPFEISKYFDNQNPFLKCDRRACNYVGEDARQYCEYRQLALAPMSKDMARGRQRAESFARFIFTEYPGINLVPEYANESFVRFFDDNAAVDEYVKQQEYGEFENRKIAVAIIFGDGDDKYDFVYSIRANSTNYNIPEGAGRPATLTHPKTKIVFDDFAASDKTCGGVPGAPNQGNLTESCTGQYIYNGVISMQRLVGDWIHTITLSKQFGYYIAEHGMSYVYFPTKSYSVDGFYKTINRELTFRAAMPLMIDARLTPFCCSICPPYCGPRSALSCFCHHSQHRC